MSAYTYTADEEKLFVDIKNGKTFNKGDQLHPFYRKHLLNLLWMQGDSEYAGALGYMPWIAKAPTVHEKVLVAQIVKDEMRHAYTVYKLLEDLGQDVPKHIAAKEHSFRVDPTVANIGFKRMKDDFRVNIFYYPIPEWVDFNLFNFLMDRAAGHQLEDTFQSSYVPWKEAIGPIFKEETMHMAHGDKWIKEMATDPKTKAKLQERLNVWWPRVLNVFGSGKGQANDLYVKLGLKKRTNGEVRTAFTHEIERMTKDVGLTLPTYNEADQPT